MMSIRPARYRDGLRLVPLVVILLVLMAACRQSVGGVPDAQPLASDVTIDLAPVGSGAQTIGPTTLRVTLTDDTNAPVTGATVTLRGDMNHAGMIPVESIAADRGDGTYDADFEWTMIGEWIVTVRAELADGGIVVESFDFSVTLP